MEEFKFKFEEEENTHDTTNCFTFNDSVINPFGNLKEDHNNHNNNSNIGTQNITNTNNNTEFTFPVNPANNDNLFNSAQLSFSNPDLFNIFSRNNNPNSNKNSINNLSNETSTYENPNLNLSLESIQSPHDFKFHIDLDIDSEKKQLFTTNKVSKSESTLFRFPTALTIQILQYLSLSHLLIQCKLLNKSNCIVKLIETNPLVWYYTTLGNTIPPVPNLQIQKSIHENTNRNDPLSDPLLIRQLNSIRHVGHINMDYDSSWDVMRRYHDQFHSFHTMVLSSLQVEENFAKFPLNKLCLLDIHWSVGVTVPNTLKKIHIDKFSPMCYVFEQMEKYNETNDAIRLEELTIIDPRKEKCISILNSPICSSLTQLTIDGIEPSMLLVISELQSLTSLDFHIVSKYKNAKDIHSDSLTKLINLRDLAARIGNDNHGFPLPFLPSVTRLHTGFSSFLDNNTNKGVQGVHEVHVSTGSKGNVKSYSADVVNDSLSNSINLIENFPRLNTLVFYNEISVKEWDFITNPKFENITAVECKKQKIYLPNRRYQLYTSLDYDKFERTEFFNIKESNFCNLSTDRFEFNGPNIKKQKTLLVDYLTQISKIEQLNLFDELEYREILRMEINEVNVESQKTMELLVTARYPHIFSYSSDYIQLIHQLPNKLFLQCSSFISLNVIFRIFPRLSHQYDKLIHSSTFHDFMNNQPPSKCIYNYSIRLGALNCSSCLSCIQHICLQSNDHNSMIDYFPLYYCTNLKILEIDWVVSQRNIMFTRVFDRCPNLTELRITFGRDCGKTGILDDLYKWSKLKKLFIAIQERSIAPSLTKSLMLCVDNGVYLNSLKFFGDEIESCLPHFSSSLTELHFTANVFSIETCSVLTQLTLLKILSYDIERRPRRIDKSDISKFASQFAKLQNLTHLYVTPAFAEVFTDLWPGNDLLKLKKITLVDNHDTNSLRFFSGDNNALLREQCNEIELNYCVLSFTQISELVKFPNVKKFTFPSRFQLNGTKSNSTKYIDETNTQYGKFLNSILYDCIDHVTDEFIEESYKQRFLQRLTLFSEAKEFKPTSQYEGAKFNGDHQSKPIANTSSSCTTSNFISSTNSNTNNVFLRHGTQRIKIRK